MIRAISSEQHKLEAGSQLYGVSALKDAYLLQKYFQDDPFSFSRQDAHRLRNSLRELALPISDDLAEEEQGSVGGQVLESKDKRDKLAVAAWLEWAGLPETGFLHADGRDGFTPQRGDIVIYDKLLSDEPHDHIGIILAYGDNEILVAEGNRDNQNYSGVFYRDRQRCILGYIRIDNSYVYHYDGSYDPIL